MRIIAGKYRRLNLHAPLTPDTRPTSDRLRETVFNILMHQMLGNSHDFSHLDVLDIFAGTGALGLEALSRGARFILFIEKHPLAITTIKQNIATLGCQNQTRILKADALHLKNNQSKHFSLVFIDPPYHHNLIEPCLEILDKGGWLSPQACIVCEMGPQEGIGYTANYTAEIERSFTHAKLMFLKYTKP